MRLHRYYLYIGTLLGLAPWVSHASISPTDSVRHLDEFVVTGTQVPRTLKSIPIMTQLINRRDLERLNPRSVHDLLQMSIPGIQMSLHGAQTRLRVQGMSADHILFLLDGEPINSEGNESVDLNRIDMANIERIEIIRGSASALYGSNAIGGVINFITRQAQRPLSTSLSADYGSEGMQRYHGSLGIERGTLSSLTTLSYNRQSGYDLPTEAGRFAIKGGHTYNASEKLRYRSQDHRWDASLYLYGSLRNQDAKTKTKDHYRSYDVGARVSYTPSLRHSGFVSYNHSTYNHSTFFFTATHDRYLKLFDLHTHRARGQYNFGQEGQDRILLNAGIDAVWESITGDRIVSSGETFSSSTIALYGQAEWHLMPRLSATLGFREDLHSEFGSHFTPRLTLLYKQNQWRIRLGYSEGFRSPSTKELRMNWDHNGMFRIKGNPDLKPETSRMISLAPELNLENFSLTLLTSYNRIHNKIFTQSEDNGLVMRYRNGLGYSELWLAQASLRWLITRDLRLNLDYAYVRDLFKVHNRAGQAMTAVTTRPHNITASLTYQHQWGQWLGSIDASTRFSSAATSAVLNPDLNDYEAVHYEAYNIMRLGGSLSWRHKAKATLGLDNLLDFRPKYINNSSSLSPGRTLFASLAVYL